MMTSSSIRSSILCERVVSKRSGKDVFVVLSFGLLKPYFIDPKLTFMRAWLVVNFRSDTVTEEM